MESNNNNIPDDEVDDDIINDTIETLENYLFGKSGDCGEKLFIDFAKNNKQHFIDAKLGQSTENIVFSKGGINIFCSICFVKGLSFITFFSTGFNISTVFFK